MVKPLLLIIEEHDYPLIEGACEGRSVAFKFTK